MQVVLSITEVEYIAILTALRNANGQRAKEKFNIDIYCDEADVIPVH